MTTNDDLYKDVPLLWSTSQAAAIRQHAFEARSASQVDPPLSGRSSSTSALSLVAPCLPACLPARLSLARRGRHAHTPLGRGLADRREPDQDQSVRGHFPPLPAAAFMSSERSHSTDLTRHDRRCEGAEAEACTSLTLYEAMQAMACVC